MKSAPAAAENAVSCSFPIVCFSHLGWDEKLYQRPQQILSRLAALGHCVYYFACVGYHRHKTAPMAGELETAPGVYVFTLPYAPEVKRMAGLRRWFAALKVAAVLKRYRVKSPVLWFYHPMLFSLGYAHADLAIVYDVMDHFPSFEQSNDDLYYEELTLLAEADVALTGGRSLDRHIRSMVSQLYNDLDPSRTSKGSAKALCDIHCFPSGIDLSHFKNALNQEPSSTIANLPGPIFGYFGAVDERLDWSLLQQLANATEGSVVLAGPHLQPPPTKLPENMHLLGGIPYAELPYLLAGFDVCLIPFKDTALVQFVSPTKTPEYLAGGKPVVSTAIPDVVSDYGDIVRIAAGGEQFVSLCLEAANHSVDSDYLSAEAARRAKTWDEIAEAIQHLLTEVIAKGERRTNAAC